MATEAVTEAKIHAIKLSEQSKSQLSIQVNPWQFLQTYWLLHPTFMKDTAPVHLILNVSSNNHFACLCGISSQVGRRPRFKNPKRTDQMNLAYVNIIQSKDALSEEFVSK